MSKSSWRVTAAEIQTGDDGSLDALINFLRPLDAGDLAGLTINWRDGDMPRMENPIGGKRRGWAAVRERYAKLFEVLPTVRVAFYDFTSQGNEDRRLFVGHEKSVCWTPATSLDRRVRTARWFVKIKGAWWQLHHPGSIEEPAVRAEYELGIFGATLNRPA